MKNWHLMHSNREGFVLVVTNESWFRDAREDVCSFFSHHIAKYLPMLPIPVIHFGRRDFCESKQWMHFHNPYTWWGKTFENFFCAYFCSWFGYRFGNELLRIKISDKKAMSVCYSKELQRFYSEAKNKAKTK